MERQILRQINLFVDILLLFYNLEGQVKSERDLKRDLITNLVTNLVLSSEVYFLVYNLQTSNQEADIKKLRTLMNNQAFLENLLPMSKLNINAQFQFDVNVRNKHERVSKAPVPSVQQPYESTIRELVKLSKMESPMQKLELIYSCCTQCIIEEISAFWKHFNIPSSKLAIDTDNLQGIVIYIVSRMKCPQLVAELSICERFLPASVKKSSRYIYFEMVSAALSFIIEQ